MRLRARWHSGWQLVGLATLVMAVSRPAAAQSFSEVNTGVQGLVSVSLAWGDYDNDGNLDLAVAGNSGCLSKCQCSRIYRNEGGGVFTNINAAIVNVEMGSLAWGDYDNDGDLDLAIAGWAGGSAWVSKVYRNDAGAFVDTNAAIVGVISCALAWGDYDNDGDLDLAISGRTSSGYITSVYRNDLSTSPGARVFTDINAGLAPVAYSALAWGDYDNDGDLDLIVAGSATASVPKTRLYRNDGNGTFTDTQAAIVNVMDPALAWGDYDNDGDLDLVITGDTDYVSATRIHRNDGNGVFTDISTSLVRIGDIGSVAWGDYDNDGDLDLALAGRPGTGDLVAKVYRNDGGGAFADIGAPLTGVGYRCSLAWGDFDNDGDLDLATAGQTPAGTYVTKLYRNNSAVLNTPPTAPQAPAATVSGHAVTFAWAAGGDAETTSAGLSYNLRVGTAPGAADVLSGAADLASGRRRLPATGNAQKRLSRTLSSLSFGAYYWSVQAIDTALAGSPWAAEGVVVVPAPSDFNTDGDVDLDDFAHLRACFNGPNRPFPVVAIACDNADLDGDADVDLADFGAFRNCFNGPNRRPGCS